MIPQEGSTAPVLGPTVRVVLYFFALLFVACGAGMLYIGLIKNPQEAREIRALVTHSPAEIKRYWRWVTTGTGNPDGVGAQNFIKLETRSQKAYQLSVNKKDVDAILAYLAQQAPEAENGPIEVQRTR